MLTGLAVAFAFRCGMFNIGGQGQYLAGAIAGVWSRPSCRGASISRCCTSSSRIVAAMLAGAAWAGDRRAS